MTVKKPVVDTIEAAMQVAAEVAEGRLAPAALEAAAVAECRQLVGQVIGPDDAVWPLQLEVARGVLAAGGVPANELAEWLSVQRQAEGAPDPAAELAAASVAALGGRDIDVRTLGQCRCGKPNCGGEHELPPAEREPSWIERALGLELPDLEPAEGVSEL